MFDVISLGTATYDVFLRSEGMKVEEGDGDKDICFRYGAKLEVNEIHFDYGGGGTNSAVTFARQGLKAAAVVQIGDDFAGQKVLKDLQKEGVATDLIDIQKESCTDYSTILWAPDGGRTILIYRGKTRLEVENVPWDKLEAKWFYISSLEGNLSIVEEVQKSKGAERQSKIAWNPGGRELKQKEELLKLLPKITVLNLNKEEMEELVWVVGDPPAGGGDMRELLGRAQKLPCEYVVITDDRRGAYLWDKANLVWWHSGIYEDSLRYETTGAGDAFCSGLVTGLIKGESLESCLYLATANASSVVTMVGAKKGILRIDDLESWQREKLRTEKVLT